MLVVSKEEYSAEQGMLVYTDDNIGGASFDCITLIKHSDVHALALLAYFFGGFFGIFVKHIQERCLFYTNDLLTSVLKQCWK